MRTFRYAVALLVFAGGLAPTSAAATNLPAPSVANVASAAARHQLGQSYFFLRVYQDSLDVRLEITTRDLDAALGFGWGEDARVSVTQIETVLDSIRGYVERQMFVDINGQPLRLEFQRFDERFLEVASFVQLYYKIAGTTGIPNQINVTFPVLFELDPRHRNFLVVEHNWQTGTFNSEAIVAVFSHDQPTQTLDLTSSNKWRGFIAMVKQGVWHIWIGLDHILFIIALLLPAVLVRQDGAWQPVPSFKKAIYSLLGIVTFFTIAHTITLSLAALELVTLPSKLVETVIAGSIAVAAWANLVPKLTIREGAIAFVFGLFHGFGFASVLADIGLGREHLVLSLVGFNLGVELGQIGIICVTFPVLFLLRKHRVYGWLLRFGSLALIAIALLWVLERSLEFNVPIGSAVRSLLGIG